MVSGTAKQRAQGNKGILGASGGHKDKNSKKPKLAFDLWKNTTAKHDYAAKSKHTKAKKLTDLDFEQRVDLFCVLEEEWGKLGCPETYFPFMAAVKRYYSSLNCEETSLWDAQAWETAAGKLSRWWEFRNRLKVKVFYALGHAKGRRKLAKEQLKTKIPEKILLKMAAALWRAHYQVKKLLPALVDNICIRVMLQNDMPVRASKDKSYSDMLNDAINAVNDSYADALPKNREKFKNLPDKDCF